MQMQPGYAFQACAGKVLKSQQVSSVLKDTRGRILNEEHGRTELDQRQPSVNANEAVWSLAPELLLMVLPSPVC